MSDQTLPQQQLSGAKWRMVLLLSLAALLVLGLWFSASAVSPVLIEAWSLTTGQATWLTLAVQIGFVIGALVSALLNVADIFPPRVVFGVSALSGAAANAAIALLDPGFGPTVVLRFMTGFAIAGVYPVGMKILATWLKEDRGLGLGFLVGALAIGSASPHLIRAFGGVGEWQRVLYVASALAVAGGLLVLWGGHLGPFRTAPAPFRWRYAADALRDEGVRLANFGYLGHMWELYAMWTWIALFLLEVFQAGGRTVLWGLDPAVAASLVTFLVIAASGPASVVAGWLGDHWGRTNVTVAAMLVSGSCALVIGWLVGLNPLLVTAVALLWGLTIAPDSAQFSTAISELADKRYMGTALTLQTSMGFLLTLVTIRLVPVLVARFGWGIAFALLALGPAFGIWAMRRLRGLPDAAQLAGGRG